MSDFSELYDVVRPLLGDINTATPVYTTAQLDLGISLGLLSDEVYSRGDDDVTGGKTIAPDVSEKADALRLALRAAIYLLSPQSGSFSYRTRVLSVTRENARRGHLAYLENLLQELEDEEVTGYSESEWDQIIRSATEAAAILTTVG